MTPVSNSLVSDPISLSGEVGKIKQQQWLQEVISLLGKFNEQGACPEQRELGDALDRLSNAIAIVLPAAKSSARLAPKEQAAEIEELYRAFISDPDKGTLEGRINMLFSSKLLSAVLPRGALVPRRVIFVDRFVLPSLFTGDPHLEKCGNQLSLRNWLAHVIAMLMDRKRIRCLLDRADGIE